jgi:hypothetical protein
MSTPTATVQKFPLIRFTGVRNICECASDVLGCRLCYDLNRMEIYARNRLEKKRLAAIAIKIPFSHLYEDILLKIGEYLDLNSSIALYLAIPATSTPTLLALQKNMHIKISDIKPPGLSKRDAEKMLIFLGKINEKDLRKLGSGVIGSLVEKISNIDLLPVMLADHSRLFNLPRHISYSKQNHAKFGHIYQNKYLAAELWAAFLNVLSNCWEDLTSYYYTLFNIELDYDGEVHWSDYNALHTFRVFERDTPACCDDPLAQLGIICERITDPKILYISLKDIYESIYSFTFGNFKEKKSQQKAMKKYFSLMEAMDSTYAYVLAKYETVEEFYRYILDTAMLDLPWEMEKVIGISVWNLPIAERRISISKKWPVMNVNGNPDINTKLRFFAEHHYI